MAKQSNIQPSKSGNEAAQKATERQSISEVQKKTGRSPFGPGGGKS